MSLVERKILILLKLFQKIIFTFELNNDKVKHGNDGKESEHDQHKK